MHHPVSGKPMLFFQVRSASPFAGFDLENDMVYQGRLGKNIRKTQKQGRFSQTVCLETLFELGSGMSDFHSALTAQPKLSFRFARLILQRQAQTERQR